MHIWLNYGILRSDVYNTHIYIHSKFASETNTYFFTMKIYTKLVIGCCVAWATCTGALADDTMMWYRQPADEWMKALPIGNGRLGAMIYGGVEEETIALNESSMWSGGYNPTQDRPFGKERMRKLQQMSLDGRHDEVNRIANDSLTGRTGSFGSHLPIGDMKLKFSYPQGETSSYRRQLDLTNAVSSVTYKIGDTEYSREYIASNPDDVLAMNFTASRKGAISFEMTLDLLRKAEIRTENGQLIFEGRASLHNNEAERGVCFIGRIAIDADNGLITATDSSIIVSNADAVKIIADVRTDYKNEYYKPLCIKTVNNALSTDFEDLKREHIADYSPLFSRVSLTLGKDNSNTPTDVRRQAVEDGGTDAGLHELFFQFGRYLTIASSRENSPLPIALQGFFNDNLACNMGWTNDYHLDINTQQNYWLANVGNLAECNIPLFNYINDLAYYGEETAQKVYGCRGWTAHTTANVWGFSALSGAIWWGLHPTAGSWLATHLWTQYEYTHDRRFLAEVAYPLLKGNAQFLLDYMVEDPKTGYMVTGPSISPENSFGWNGQNLCAAMMPTCDRVFAYEIMNACISSSELLNIDKPFADSLRAVVAKLPPIRISKKYGGVMEWYEDFDETQPNHRHTTHLLSLYPYAQITLDKTPELADAANVTIERRLNAEGWEDVEWSRANMICYYARLKQTDKATNSVNTLLGKLSRENLFTISPEGIAGAPYDIFAIDGNMAGAAGIAEMLVQCHEGYVEFLPCMPREWNEGSFKGLCVKGGAEVSASWKKGKITSASLTATADGTFTIKLPKGIKSVRVKGIGKKADAKDGFLTIELKKGDKIELNK